MSISESEVKKIAKLARLNLTPAETELYRDQLGKILLSMDELRAVDTSQVAPTSSVLGTSNVMRPDIAQRFEACEKILQNAPDRDGPYFKVRKVIE